MAVDYYFIGQSAGNSSTGTITPAQFGPQSANTVLSGPTTGAAANPAFRALVAADIPSTLNATTFSGNVTLGSTSITLGATGSTLVAQFISSPANLFQLSGPSFPGFLLGASGATTGVTAQYGGTTAGIPILQVSAGNLGTSAGITTARYFGSTVSAFANSNATTYAFGFADATHTNIYTNGTSAVAFDSSQNAVFSATLSTKAVNAAYTANQTLTAAQSFGQIYFNGSTAAQTITLPTAAAGLVYTILNHASVPVSVTAGVNILANGLAASTTRGLSAFTAGVNMSSATFICDGTNWFVIAPTGTIT